MRRRRGEPTSLGRGEETQLAVPGGDESLRGRRVSVSDPIQPVLVSVVPDNRPRQVVIISHSPLFYWWPVWVVGFLVAGWSFWHGDQVAFVPPGTVAERGALVEGHDGPRDVLIAPAGRSLPPAAPPARFKHP